jgi:hypothetical protein
MCERWLTPCSDHPELQAKIRRVIEQGHIDAEDFKGVSDGCRPAFMWFELMLVKQDPAFNVPGKSGIRGRAKKAEPADEAGEVCLPRAIRTACVYCTHSHNP